MSEQINIDKNMIEGMLKTLASNRNIVHYLLKNGAIAISGPITFHENKIRIDITDVDDNYLSQVSAKEESTAVAFLNGERWIFLLDTLRINSDDGRVFLISNLPPSIEVSEAREKIRIDLDPGQVQILINEERFSVINLGEGGCAFKAAAAYGRSIPPSTEIDSTMECANGARITAKIKIVRIQYDFANPVEAEAVISCKFLGEHTGAVIEAALDICLL